MTPTEYTQLHTLLAEYSKRTAAMDLALGEIKKVQLAASEQLLPYYSALQMKVAELEKNIRELSEKHYDQLFVGEKRTHKSPYGSIAFRVSTVLDVEDEEKTRLRIELLCRDEAAAAHRESRDARFVSTELIRTHEELNLEAIEKLDDATLALIGVKRVKKDNFKVSAPDIATDRPAAKKTKKQLQEAA